MKYRAILLCLRLSVLVGVVLPSAVTRGASTAALYSIYSVDGESISHADGWNEVRICMVDGEGTHWFQKVYSYKIGSDDWNERIANSKWKKEGFGETAKGHIGLQDHGAKVSFRNIKIRVVESN